MPSPFSGISMLGQTLRFYQQGLDLTGHNISNLNTVGYSRQVIQYGANTPERIWGLNGAYSIGTGSSVESIYRMRNQFLDSQYRNLNSEAGKYDMLAGSARQIQSVFPEPNSAGVSDALNKFFDGWSALATSPNDPAARLQLQMAAETLTSRVRSTYSQLQTVSQSIQATLSGQLKEVDNISASIAELNIQIMNAKASGTEPSDLLDKRDQLLNKLSGYLPIQTQIDTSGALRIYSGSLRLVDGNISIPIPKEIDVANLSVSDGARSYPLTSGSLLGALQSAKSANDNMAKLDQLANSLRTQVNSIHQTGSNGSTTGISFFNDSNPQTGAINFDLSDEIKADPNNIMSGTTGAPGDGSLALSLSKMRETGITTLGGRTFSDYYSDILSTVGRDIASFSNSLDTAIAMVNQVDAQIQSVSGVNLDEEMTNLLKFQRSYQAAAKALSVFDQIAEELVNLIR
jgi:flagellar hook-associated protein 1 FlgK